jgi:succinoglycan biosynthesis protein ExoW
MWRASDGSPPGVRVVAHARRMADVTVTRVAAVIPYYQRQPGLLATAVASIANQRIAPGVEVEIIVVDDGSPSPASAEAFPQMPGWCRMRIIVQPNGGISVARNAGLNAVAATTDYVAFLDSDDVWAPEHLKTAIEALNTGADIYFDNSYFDEGEPYFDKLDFIKQVHGSIDIDNPATYFVDGATLFSFSLLETVSHTSQTIFRFPKYARLRFEENLKTSGEDRLYFAEMARSADRVAYHTGIMGARGRGVSVFRSRLGWDVPALERAIDEIRFRSFLLDRLAPPAREKQLIERSIDYFCDHFVFLALRNIASDAGAVGHLSLALVRSYPAFLLKAPGSLLRLSAHRRVLLAAEASRVAAVAAAGDTPGDQA